MMTVHASLSNRKGIRRDIRLANQYIFVHMQIKYLSMAEQNVDENSTGQQIFKIGLLPGKVLVNMIDPFNVCTNIISDSLDHVGI